MAEDWDWRKSGDNTNLDIAIGIDEINPDTIARAALDALDKDSKAGIEEHEV